MAAIAENGVIGRDGAMPWHLPADLRRFRQVTMGHVLVMGRRTYESIGRPLPGRTTIVVSRQVGWRPDGDPAGEVLVAQSVPEAIERASAVGDETFIQGGAQVYAEALTFADTLLITWVEGSPQGDTTFPPVDWTEWEETASESFEGGTWTTYRRAT